MINNTPKKYCEFNCPLQDKGFNITESIKFVIQDRVDVLIDRNKDLHPSCIKRLVAEILKDEGTRIFIELVDEGHVEKVAQ